MTSSASSSSSYVPTPIHTFSWNLPASVSGIDTTIKKLSIDLFEDLALLRLQQTTGNKTSEIFSQRITVPKAHMRSDSMILERVYNQFLIRINQSLNSFNDKNGSEIHEFLSAMHNQIISERVRRISITPSEEWTAAVGKVIESISTPQSNP